MNFNHGTNKKENSGSAYINSSLSQNITKPAKNHRTVIHLKPRTPNSNISDVGLIYGYPSNFKDEVLSSTEDRKFNQRPSTTSYINQNSSKIRDDSNKPKSRGKSRGGMPNSSVNGYAGNSNRYVNTKNNRDGLLVDIYHQDQPTVDSTLIGGIQAAPFKSISGETVAPPTSSSSTSILQPEFTHTPQKVSGSRKIYMNPNEGSEIDKLKLVRPTSRKLYLGSTETNTESERRKTTIPKSAGALKSTSSIPIKRMNSFHGIPGCDTIGSTQLEKRPPSRQSSAFPVHLIGEKSQSPRTYHLDINEAISGRTNNIGVEASSSTPVSIRSSRKKSVSDITLERITTPPKERPPSRQKLAAQDLWDGGPSTAKSSLSSSAAAVYAKSEDNNNNNNSSSSSSSCNQLPSRYSERAHHDPKSDGFLDIDDNENAPFKVEFNNDYEEIELEADDDYSIESSNGRPFTVQGEFAIPSSLYQQSEVYRSSSAPWVNANIIHAKNYLPAPPAFMQNQNDISKKSNLSSRSSHISKNSALNYMSSSPTEQRERAIFPSSSINNNNSSSPNTTKVKKYQSPDDPIKCNKFLKDPLEKSGGWMRVESPSKFDHISRSPVNIPIIPMLMTRVTSSPNSIKSGLDIYDDDEDSILTEESGDIGVSQSTQSIALMSSLGEDFLNLFAPGL